MTRIEVATADDMDDFVASVEGLFIEDGGRFDSTMDTGWPKRAGAAYYGGLDDDPNCLLALARDRGAHPRQVAVTLDQRTMIAAR